MLPYVQKPAPTVRRIGSPESGYIEMVVRGGLTVTESRMISALEEEQESPLVASARIAEAIATAENITIVEAFNIIQAKCRGADLEEGATAIVLRHASEIETFLAKLRQNNDISSDALVTVLLRTRCDLPDWQLSDIPTLDGAIYHGILRLAADEQAAERMESAPPSEDDLKKRLPDSGPTAEPHGTGSSGS